MAVSWGGDRHHFFAKISKTGKPRDAHLLRSQLTAVHAPLPNPKFHLKHKENTSREIHTTQPKAAGCRLLPSRVSNEEKLPHSAQRMPLQMLIGTIPVSNEFHGRWFLLFSAKLVMKGMVKSLVCLQWDSRSSREWRGGPTAVGCSLQKVRWTVLLFRLRPFRLPSAVRCQTSAGRFD